MYPAVPDESIALDVPGVNHPSTETGRAGSLAVHGRRSALAGAPQEPPRAGRKQPLALLPRPPFLPATARPRPPYHRAHGTRRRPAREDRSRTGRDRGRAPHARRPHRYVGHVVGDGVGLFRLACEHDSEGIVAKSKQSAYRLTGQRSPWVKVKNADYGQARDRQAVDTRTPRRIGTETRREPASPPVLPTVRP